MEEKKFMATKISHLGNYSEEMTYTQVSELLLTSNFMTMLNRIKIGETLYHNDIKIEFKRTV